MASEVIKVPVPKKKTSPARRDRRRASNSKLESPMLEPCPKCGEMKLPHRVCPNCGSYRGKEIIKIEKD
jgi:large subunit ribosomal protein L32